MATSSVMCSSSSTTRTRGFGRDESDTVGIVGAGRAVLAGRRELQGSPEAPPSAGVDPAPMAVDTLPLMVTHAADSDLSTDLDALLPLVAPLVTGHSDVAIGTRLAPGSRVVRGPKREAISRTYNLILKTTLHSGFSDAQCGFKAMRADVGRTLLPLVEDDSWFFDTELLVLAEDNGLRIHEVPVDWVDDPGTTVHIARTARDDLLGVWRMLRRRASGAAYVAADLRPPAAVTDVSLLGQPVRFASIGAVSTVAFAALFWLLSSVASAVVADVVALGACALANTAANRRLTFALRGRAGRRRHYSAGMALSLLPLAATLATLAVVHGTGAQLVALT